MSFISFLALTFGAVVGHSTPIAYDVCSLGECDIDSDDGLNLLQRSSSLKSMHNANQKVSSAGLAAVGKSFSGRKYDPENQVYNDVDVGQAAGLGSDSDSGSGSGSSPSSPPPSPTPTPPPPSPTPTSAPASSPTPAPAPTTAAPAATTVTHAAMTTTTTTTAYNNTNQTGAAAYDSDDRNSRGPGSMMMCLIGIICFAGSFCVNWRTEKAATMMETLYDRAGNECKEVGADKADPKNRNSLVLVTGKLTPVEPVTEVGPVKGGGFGVAGEGCLGIRATVSIYAKESDDGGGKGKGKGKGEERKPQYQWTCMPTATAEPAGLAPGIYTSLAPSSDLGQGFSVDLSDFHAGANMNSNLSWKPRSFGSEVSLKSKPTLKFKIAPDDKYYTGNKEHPKENDLMVEFEEMESSSACTIMALQIANPKEAQKDTFLPYVLIPHACPCYDADSEQEKEALLEGGKAALEADKHLEDEVKVDCWSMMSCAFCFGVMFRPEIRFIDSMKSVTKEKVLQQMRDTTSTMKWVCRVVGYLMLFFGIKWMFDPIADVLHFIPLIGGLLSGLVGLVIWVFALIVSITIYLLIKIVAAAFFNPVRALVYGGVLAVLIILIAVLGGSSSPAHSGHHKF